MSESNQTWLGNAMLTDWDIAGAPWTNVGRPKPRETLPDLPDGLIYKLRANGVCSIVGWYRNSNGEWKRITRSIGAVSHLSDHGLKEHIIGLSDGVQDTLERLHVPADQGVAMATEERCADTVLANSQHLEMEPVPCASSIETDSQTSTATPTDSESIQRGLKRYRIDELFTPTRSSRGVDHDSVSPP